MVTASTLGLFPSFDETVVVNLIWTLAVSTMLVFMLQDAGDLQLFAEGSSDDIPLRDFDKIDVRCDVLGLEHHLTNRELETMKLICKGRSKRYIAEHLMLSENTVRGYAKALYGFQSSCESSRGSGVLYLSFHAWSVRYVLWSMP